MNHRRWYNGFLVTVIVAGLVLLFWMMSVRFPRGESPLVSAPQVRPETKIASASQPTRINSRRNRKPMRKSLIVKPVHDGGTSVSSVYGRPAVPVAADDVSLDDLEKKLSRGMITRGEFETLRRARTAKATRILNENTPVAGTPVSRTTAAAPAPYQVIPQPDSRVVTDMTILEDGRRVFATSDGILVRTADGTYQTIYHSRKALAQGEPTSRTESLWNLTYDRTSRNLYFLAQMTPGSTSRQTAETTGGIASPRRVLRYNVEKGEMDNVVRGTADTRYPLAIGAWDGRLYVVGRAGREIELVRYNGQRSESLPIAIPSPGRPTGVFRFDSANKRLLFVTSDASGVMRVWTIAPGEQKVNEIYGTHPPFELPPDGSLLSEAIASEDGAMFTMVGKYDGSAAGGHSLFEKTASGSTRISVLHLDRTAWAPERLIRRDADGTYLLAPVRSSDSRLNSAPVLASDGSMLQNVQRGIVFLPARSAAQGVAAAKP